MIARLKPLISAGVLTPGARLTPERELAPAFVETGLAFHRAIFDAARNPICTRMFSLIHRDMGSSILLTSQLVDWDHTLEFHRPIYMAIKRRNPVEAPEAKVAHLSGAKSLLSRTWPM